MSAVPKRKQGVVDVDIRLEDLADTQRKIAELIGLDNYIKLSKRFGGINNFYIHKYSEIIREARNREIRKKYNGYNAKMLAAMYNLSEQTIYEICKYENNEQLKLF